MMAGLKAFGDTLVKSAFEFAEDRCPRLAAALSYYTIFSLPPLLIIVFALLGFILDPNDIRTHLREQVEAVFGAEAAQQIQDMVSNADQSKTGGIAGTAGVAALLLGATAVVVQLQDAMNKVWQVAPDPNRGGIKNFIVKRFLSFAMILGVAFLLLVSLVITTVISIVSERISIGTGENWGFILKGVNSAVSILVITGLVALMFKFLPDAEVQWRSVWVGAFITAVLFTVGKFGLGMYLGQRDLGSVYGAAGSLALILIWVYYSGMIFFYGAEFTQVWARKNGHHIVPEKGAVRVEKQKTEVSA